MTKRKQLYLQLCANLIPLIGYWFFDWNMFAIIYMYWAEGFIVAFFTCIRIVMAQGTDPYRPVPDTLGKRILTAFKFFLFRAFILFFYWIFIFAFVAFPGGGVHKEMMIQNYTIMFFQNVIFNNALLIYFLTQLILFLSDFIASEDYKTEHPRKYRILFDGRTIVLHIVIVLGTFTYKYLQQYEGFSNRLPGLSYVAILVILKSIADFIQYRLAEQKLIRQQ